MYTLCPCGVYGYTNETFRMSKVDVCAMDLKHANIGPTSPIFSISMHLLSANRSRMVSYRPKVFLCDLWISRCLLRSCEQCLSTYWGTKPGKYCTQSYIFWYFYIFVALGSICPWFCPPAHCLHSFTRTLTCTCDHSRPICRPKIHRNTSGRCGCNICMLQVLSYYIHFAPVIIPDTWMPHLDTNWPQKYA